MKFIILILFLSFILAVCGYLILPLLVLFLHQEMCFTFLDISICLTLKLLAHRAGAILNIYWLLYFNEKALVIFGLVLQMLSFLILLYATNVILICLSMILHGLSSSTHVPALKALLLKSELFSRVSLLSIFNIVRNLGVASGATLGAALITQPFRFTIQISLFLLIIIMVIMLILPIRHKLPAYTEFRVHAFDGVKAVYRTCFKYIFIPTMLFGIAYAQLEFSIPFFVETFFTKKYLYFLFLVNTLIIIMLQFFMAKYFIARCHNKNLISIAILNLMLMTIFSMIHYHVGFVIVSIIFFTFAEMIMLITFDKILIEKIANHSIKIGLCVAEVFIGVGTISGYSITTFAHYIAGDFYGHFINNLIVTIIVMYSLYNWQRKQ